MLSGSGLCGSRERYRRAYRNGYIIGQFYWLPRFSSLIMGRSRVIHWRPLCVRMVAEWGTRFELGSCAILHGSSRARFDFVGSKCTSLSLDCFWLPCVEREYYRRMCWLSCSDGNGGPAEWLQYYACFFAAQKGFLWTDFVNTGEEGSFLLLSNTAGVFKWWSTGVVV